MKTDFDPFDSKARTEASKALAIERIEVRILSALEASTEGVPWSVLRRTVSGRKTYIDLALRSLWAKKLVFAVPRSGRGGGVVWGVLPHQEP